MQLTANNLTIMRGGRAIIQKLSFELAKGEALVLSGPNGSGKTTLLRTLAGFLPLSAGTISFSGGPDQRREADIPLSGQIHYIGHRNAIKNSLTVMENLEFWAGFLGEGSKAEAVRSAMDRFNLAALGHIPGSYLSAGQTRRLGLARLLVARRPLWLLDEPTVSLDSRSRAIVSDVINDHIRSGGMVIAATHIPLGLDRPRELHLGGAPESGENTDPDHGSQTGDDAGTSREASP